MVTRDKIEEKNANVNASPCIHCDGNRIIFLIIFWGWKFAREHGDGEKSGKELENDHCLLESYSTMYARKFLNSNKTSFFKCKGKMYTWMSVACMCLYVTHITYG